MNFEDDYFHQIIVGGTQPVSTSTSSGSGMVGITGVPTPSLDKKIAASLVRIDELWVQDRDRQDYTTIRMVRPDIMIDGKIKRRNLCGLNDNLGKDTRNEGLPSLHTQGLPERGGRVFLGAVGNRQHLQAAGLAQRSAPGDFPDHSKLRADPPRSAIGFSGMTLEKYKAFKRPGGFVSEENPNAKLQEHEPELPAELFTLLDKTIQMFDDVAGFTPVLQGQGEPGVRSQSQTSSLTRNASPRMRDRSLLVERQCTEVGDFALKMLQAKDAEVVKAGKTTEFILSQLPDDARVTVDSHTSSPVYQEDSERKAFMLQRAGAIDAEDLIMLTHPPHEDTLRARAKSRARSPEQNS